MSSLYGGVEDSLNVRVEYRAADQILSFYVALESLSSSWIAALYKCKSTFNKRLLCSVLLSTYLQMTKACKRDFTHLNSHKSLERWNFKNAMKRYETLGISLISTHIKALRGEILIWILKTLWHFPDRNHIIGQSSAVWPLRSLYTFWACLRAPATSSRFCK